MWTYSSPCQDISVAGRLAGISKDTRSGLIYEVGRLLKIAKDEGTLPKYLLLENVKNFVGKKIKPQFDEWMSFLESMGYITYWQVLNAKDYGIPQNRQRVFGISIRKDLEKTFDFPEKIPLNLRLLDILEANTCEKYYVSEDKSAKLIEYLRDKEIANTIRVAGRGAYDKKHNWDCVAVKEAVKQGYSIAEVGDSINFEQVNSKTRRGRVGKQVAQNLTTNNHQAVLIGASRGRNPQNPSDRTLGTPTEQRLEINFDGVSNTITSVQKDNLVIEQIGNILETSRFGGNPQDGRVYSTKGLSPTLRTSHNPYIVENIRVRRLTPLECWRLMGFDDVDFYKAKNSGISDTQLYKQAGNSIVVNVLEKIFKNLFINNQSV